MNVALPTKHPDELAILDACAGFGMLGEAVLLGLERLGLSGRIVCHVERDSAAAAALVARMGVSPVDQAPVWDDLATFDGGAWRGCVDIACAGLPCPAYSLAGNQLGNDDPRAWGDGFDPGDLSTWGPVPHFLRIVAECQPAVVFLENVPAWVVGGHFMPVGEELCRLGYTIEEPVFLAAEDVGAPHCRERVFVLAHRLADAERDARWKHFAQRGSDRRATDGRDREELAVGPRGGFGIGGEPPERDGQPDGREPQLADDSGNRRPEHFGVERTCGESIVADGGAELGNASRPTGRTGELGASEIERRGEGHLQGCGGIPADQLGDAECFAGKARTDHAAGVRGTGERRTTGTDLRRGQLPLFPPGRGDESDPDHPDWWAWSVVAGVDPSLMPRVESEHAMVADGLAFSRADLLRIGGNGVVPLAGAVAFATQLADAITKTRGESTA